MESEEQSFVIFQDDSDSDLDNPVDFQSSIMSRQNSERRSLKRVVPQTQNHSPLLPTRAKNKHFVQSHLAEERITSRQELLEGLTHNIYALYHCYFLSCNWYHILNIYFFLLCVCDSATQYL